MPRPLLLANSNLNHAEQATALIGAMGPKKKPILTK